MKSTSIEDGLLKRYLSKIANNGIDENVNENDREKRITFNWQVFICILVSIEFVIIGLFSGLTSLAIFSCTYFILFGLTFISSYYKKLALSTYLYLFTTNYAVTTISFCIGYEAGFYMYFLTTPLTVYATFNAKRTGLIFVALSSYLINAMVLNYLYHHGYLPNSSQFLPSTIIILFNMNLILSFLMIFMFITTFVRLNILRTKEKEDLIERKLVLESEILQKKMEESKMNYQFQKLDFEYKQLDVFNKIISHNLRSPIARISGLVELLQKYPNYEPEQEKIFSMLDSSVTQMDETVKDLNYILVQKKLGLEKNTILFLSDVLKEVKELLANEIVFSAAEIHDELPEAPIKSIRSILVSIFYNLISNSIKYSIPNKTPILHITGEIEDDYLVLTFKDNGLGFDTQKNYDKIFQLYSRFHETIPGKGIGLYLVKSHVELLEGTIELESSPYLGTEFRILLPIVK